ncbi:MAG: hypothetical protein AAFP10_01740 [Pseudomonadota bacterium]
MINKSLQNILAGAANVVDIAPCSDFSRFVPNESAEQPLSAMESEAMADSPG